MDAPTKRVEIIPAKRRAMILDYLRRSGTASIGELTEAIGGSQSTIRRDLEQLTEGGYLERTHGGALLVPPLRATFEREPALNAHYQHRQKAAIGQEATSRLKGGESVIFDSSSTVIEVVRATALRRIPLTVVTNNIEIARIGSSVPEWRVIVTGGTLRPGSDILLGNPGEPFFETIHADVCFTGAYAVTGPLLTDASMEIASIKRAMIRSARRTVLLVDSTKFQAPAFCTFAQLGQVSEVVTDAGIDPEIAAGIRASGPELTVVPVPD
ncbi:DeoR/GlpR transcriptional regulator [Aureimonas flava]|uniref:DeoR/GlpR transcriptional regulator n=1 Tax=Aureimonas flava TaxID=2320271 RepID=A0A3A1WKV9_9HYPH|nr:DeoR/GlpR family DNA-binding transcription regulator [Aureimonas flava]RIY01938.1 DeoR/GlpR transcriptional regulator [Aureimonas flava]